MTQITTDQYDNLVNRIYDNTNITYEEAETIVSEWVIKFEIEIIP